MTAGRSAQQMVVRKRAKAAQLREQADRLERDADRWELGDLGERVVGGRLELLRADGWYVLHDVRWPGRQRANLDHVVVGPPGVLVVDAKNWSGAVTLDGGRLRQNGHPRDREAHAVAEAADAVAERLGRAVSVLPVLCLASDTGRTAQVAGRTTVLGADHLVDWARSLPPRLSTDELLRLAAQVRQQLPPASARVPTIRAGGSRRTTHAHRKSVHRFPRRQRVRSRQRGRDVLVRLAFVAAALLVLPWSLNHLAASLATTAQGAAGASAAAPTVATPAVYRDCGALRATYPDGVKATGAANAGRKARPVSAVDTALATANGRLDDDGDGLVCERLRPRHRGTKH